MRNAYTCLSCRLHHIAREHRRLSIQHRRWMSQGSEWRHGLQTSPPNRRTNEEDLGGTTRRPQRVRSKQEGDAPRGRYSGRPLAPEQLLDQLLATPTEPQHGRQMRPKLSPRAVHSAEKLVIRREAAPPQLDKPLHELRSKLYALNNFTQGPDEDFWITLKDVMSVSANRDNAKLLFEDNKFRKKFKHWTMRTVDRWLEATFAPDKIGLDPRSDIQTKSGTGLTPYQALKYKSIFNAHPGFVVPRTIWHIAKETAEYYSNHNDPSQPPSPRVREGLNELMQIWHLSMATNLRGQASVDASELSSRTEDILDARRFNWSFLPDPNSFIESLQHSAHRKDTKVSFNEIFEMLMTSSFPRISQRKVYYSDQNLDLESSAIVTMGLLQDVKSRPGGVDIVRQYEPWLTLIELSFKNVNAPQVPKALAERMKELDIEDSRRQFYRSMVDRLRLDPATIGEVGATQQALREEATSNSAEEQVENSQATMFDEAMAEIAAPPTPDKDSSHMDRFAYLCGKRLGRAVEEHNMRGAEWVRQDVANQRARQPDVAIPQKLYEIMIYSFLCLKGLRQALQLWEEMILDGHEPRLKTYTTMMRGSQWLKDLTSVEYFWNKMRQAKIQPDAAAWSTRINGLLRKGHCDAGLSALSEMGQNWIAAAKQQYMKEEGINQKRSKATPEISAPQLLKRFQGEVGGVPRPNVVIMNSALTPLSRGNNDHLIPKVLAWGRSFGIEPDLVTYNALIHVSMEHGRGAEALKIIQRMRERNIQIDRNTWTILLTDMLVGGFLDGLSSKEQEAKVLEFLSSLDADHSGAGLDQRGYALILDRLLKNYENHPAAQAVLSHMTSKGLPPSTHIYTMLMQSHLEQSPPNFAGAESLWENIQSAQGGYGANLDSKFFDLVIKGYAPYHATVGTEKILSFLNRMDTEGKRPSWSALEAAARALAETSQWARLAQIVDRRRRKLREEKGIDTGTGQRSFWQFIISTGMLRHERITIPEQIMEVA